SPSERCRGSSERAPARLLPRVAAAHGAERERTDDRDPVAALGAMELALDRLAGRPELDVLVGGSARRSRSLHHPDPLRVSVQACPPRLFSTATRSVQTPEPYPPPEPEEDDWMTPQPRPSRSFEDLSGLGQTLTWVSGLILAISAFTGWYVGSGPGPTTSVIGWHTGALGKLVFVIGLAVVALVILREAGIELPAAVP